MHVSSQLSVASICRDAWVEVDLGALENNAGVVRSWLKAQTKLMAVVKSDAYGHGALAVADVLTASGIDWLGVASVDEGCQLRFAGITKPILILSPNPSWTIKAAIEANLDLTVTSLTQIKDVLTISHQLEKIAKIHLKVDTGMHRLGVLPSAVREILQLLRKEQGIRLVGIFSHLAKVDDPEFTTRQNICFQEVLNALKQTGIKVDIVHLASGEAAKNFPDTHYDLVRVGLPLYGLESQTVSKVVTPLMSVRGRINHIQNIEAGEPVGYGLTWTAQRSTRIASIPIGYGDGVDRALSNRISGLLLCKEVKQVGTISMDQMLFDISDVLQAQEGDVITLIGSESDLYFERGNNSSQNLQKCLYFATWARLLNTITYELACRMRVRMPRVYTRHAKLAI